MAPLWGCQCAQRLPPVNEYAHVAALIVRAVLPTPIWQRLLDSINRNSPNNTSIRVLHFWCCPPDVSRNISKRSILPVNAVADRWRRAYVRKESLEGLCPLRVQRYTGATIPFVCVRLRVACALLERAPYPVFPSVRASKRSVRSLEVPSIRILLAATARFGGACFKRDGVPNATAPTIAQAIPGDTATSIGRPILNQQLTKALPG